MRIVYVLTISFLLAGCASRPITESSREPASTNHAVNQPVVQNEAVDVPKITPEDLAAIKSVDIDLAQKIANKKVSDYPNDAAGRAQLIRDLNDFHNESQKLGIFPKDRSFEEYWDYNVKKFTAANARLALKDTPVNQLALTIFAAAEADVANALDAADPNTKKLRKDGLPTRGDEHFVQVTEKAEGRRSLVYTGYVALGAASAVVLAKIKDIFFFGTGSQLTNTVAEPFIRPIRERLDQIVNTYLAPRLVPWARFVTGEAGRQRRALKAAAKGVSPEAVKGGVNRYLHPAVSVEDFVRDHKDFYGEMMAADAKWKGWLSAEFQRARNTGWEIMYNQPRWLNEQLNTFSTAINTAKLVQSQTLVPALLKEGAEIEDIERLAKLIKIQQDIMVFEDLKSPKIAELEKEIMDIVQKWLTTKNVKSETLRAFYEGQLQLVMAENRPAFALAAFLDGERYFQENNIALKDLPKLQMWQEQGREMTGIYIELRKHHEKIEKFFLKRGIKYDVMARVNERGYPLGGKTRPKNVAPITDVVLDHLDGLDRASTSGAGPSCTNSAELILKAKL